MGTRASHSYFRQVLLLFLICFASFLGFNANREIVHADNLNIDVVYFYMNPCEACDEEGKFLEKFNQTVGNEKSGVEVNVLMYNTFHAYKNELFLQYAEKYQVPKEMRDFPIVFIEDNYISGDSAIDKNLRNAFINAKKGIQPQNTDKGGNQENILGNYGARPEIKDDNNTRLVYFYVSPCSSCVSVSKVLDSVKDNYKIEIDGKRIVTNTILTRYNINIPENLQLAREYFKLYKVPENYQKVPIIFLGDTYLSGEDVIKDNLIKEISNGRGMNTPEISLKDVKPDETQSSLSGYAAAGVFLTGIVNGLNPCSISMLLFFLSVLMARRASVLKLAVPFIAGKFISYLALGTLLFNLLLLLSDSFLEIFGLISKILLLIFALVLMILNLMDYFSAKGEKYDRIKLQLPKSLRQFNHGWIEKAVSLQDSRLLLLICFLLGIVISVGEFLCTGQIYLATIISMLKSTTVFSMKAAYYFVIYGTALIIPLIALTLIVYKGKELFEVSEAFRSKLHIVKLINGLVFLAFAIVAVIWF